MKITPKRSDVTDGTIKRSGTFNESMPVGQWTTYDSKGEVYKVSDKKIDSKK